MFIQTSSGSYMLYFSSSQPAPMRKCKNFKEGKRVKEVKELRKVKVKEELS